MSIIPLPTFTNEYPTLEDLFEGGGRPGVEYALVLNKDSHQYYEEGWEYLRDMVPFTVRGESGEAVCVAMGKGEPIQGADPMNGVRPYSISAALEVITGIKIETPEEEAEDGIEAQDQTLSEGNGKSLQD